MYCLASSLCVDCHNGIILSSSTDHQYIGDLRLRKFKISRKYLSPMCLCHQAV